VANTDARALDPPAEPSTAATSASRTRSKTTAVATQEVVVGRNGKKCATDESGNLEGTALDAEVPGRSSRIKIPTFKAKWAAENAPLEKGNGRTSRRGGGAKRRKKKN